MIGSLQCSETADWDINSIWPVKNCLNNHLQRFSICEPDQPGGILWNMTSHLDLWCYSIVITNSCLYSTCNVSQPKIETTAAKYNGHPIAPFDSTCWVTATVSSPSAHEIYFSYPQRFTSAVPDLSLCNCRNEGQLNNKSSAAQGWPAVAKKQTWIWNCK